MRRHASLLCSFALAQATAGCGFPDYSGFGEPPLGGSGGLSWTRITISLPLEGGAPTTGSGGGGGGGGGTAPECTDDDDCLESTGGTGECVDGTCVSGCPVGFADCNLDPDDGCEVDLATDAVHCGSCATPCAPPPNAEAVCSAGQCALGACATGFADCDGAADSGCETNLSSPETCGGCTRACELPHAVAGCADGKCLVAACAAGWANCDAAADNGCEVDVRADAKNCGACWKSCYVEGGLSGCTDGACAVVDCISPHADCNGVVDDGCEVDVRADMGNCGACGAECVVAFGEAQCTTGVCSVSKCDTARADCNGLPTDGCETDTTTDIAACGECGKPCSDNHGLPTCAGGACTIECTPPFSDCDGLLDNGCETDTTKNVDHCGGCGEACSAAGGVPNCVDGKCGISTCKPPLADCDSDPATGCEIDTWADPANCGGCGKACSIPHGSPACSAGACAIATCLSSYDDCNGLVADGCETSLRSLSSCGACGEPCNLPHATATCMSGACNIVACVSPFADCDGLATNGCETDTSTNLANCGACAKACNADHGAPSCAGGNCTITCATGWGNCNASAGDGCETDVTSNPSACGACGTTCTVAHGTASCVASKCIVGACLPPFSDCDGAYENGCETDVSQSVANCGSCGHACPDENGAAACVNWSCALACAAGFGDCDGQAATGCETDLRTTPGACGSCWTACSFFHATAACVSSTCQLGACEPGHGNCDGTSSNGCETPLTTLSNCGGCNELCDLPNASESCATGTCTLGACVAGFANCDGAAGNGCETSLSTSTSSCGACGAACETTHGTASCVLGACAIACEDGYASCDNDVTNGCETSLVSLGSCGACGLACTNAHGGTSCNGGSCAPSCAIGWGDCDGTPSNGCETSLSTVVNCGGCGAGCFNTHGVTSCVAYACLPSCNLGWGDCDGIADNGCETSLTTASNCGVCGKACSNPHGSVSCVAGACVPLCSPGFSDCDGNAVNGCETATSSDPANCGACDVACVAAGATATCTSGTCSFTCAAGFGDCDGSPKSGCETPLSSISNCGACANACVNPHGTTSCAFGACVPTCSLGWGDCDGDHENGCEADLLVDPAHCGGCAAACPDSAPCCQGICGSPSKGCG